MEITLMTDSFFIIILLNKENSKKTKLLSERPNRKGYQITIWKHDNLVSSIINNTV